MVRNFGWLVGLLLAGVLVAGGQKKSDVLKIGVTVGDLGNPFFVQIGEGVKNRAYRESADAQVTVLSSDYDLSKQSSQLDSFIGAGVDLIVLNAADTKGIAPAVRRVKEAGIVIVAVDVAAEGGVDAVVTSDNVSAGKQAAQYLVDRLGGEGNVIIINGPPVSAVIDRVEGAQQVFSNSRVNILSDNQNAGGSRDGGLRVMTNLLTAFPKIDAVFAINDPTGIGAALAIEQAGRSDEMFVVGVDGAPDAVVALKEKKLPFLASSSQDPFSMAEKATDIGLRVMHGESLKDSTILVPVTLVTRDNVDKYVGWTKKATR